MSAPELEVNNSSLERAVSLYEQGEYIHAESLCREILTGNPGNADAWNLIGIIAGQIGHSEQAIEYINKAIELNPQEIRYYSNLAEIYNARGELGYAIKKHEMQGAVNASFQLARDLLDIDAHEAARIALQRVLEFSPAHSQAHFEMGKLKLEQGNFKEAVSHYIDYLAESNENIAKHDVRLVNFQRVRDYCQRQSLPYHVIQKEQVYKIHFPMGWNETESRNETTKQSEYYIAEVNDALIVGGKDLVIVDENLVLYDLAFHQESTRYELTDEVVRYCAGEHALIDINNQIENEFEEAIMLSGFASFNYSHWLIEYLPRFLGLNELVEYQHLPLLVDMASINDSHQLEMLQIMNKSGRKIIPMQAGSVYRCKRLIVPSALSTMPINLKSNTAIKANDVVISKAAIDYMRQNFYKPDHGKYHGPERLYISRKNASFRRLANEDEIQELFESYGFEVISPDRLSVSQKLSLFNNAKFIAGPGSSGFTNILFSPPNANVLFLISDVWREGTFLSNISGSIGQNLRCVYGQHISGTHNLAFHCDYFLDKNEVRQAIEGMIH